MNSDGGVAWMAGCAANAAANFSAAELGALIKKAMRFGKGLTPNV